jgi:alanine racemase
MNNNGQRPTWAEINLELLASNYKLIKQRVGPDVKVMAVVKADAYGHGAVECAQRLGKEGVDWFGVALPEEGIKLRLAGISQPILCLAGFWPGQAAACVRYKLVPVVYRFDMAEALNEAARAAGTRADVHFKVDTGMGRLGARFDRIDELLNALRRLDHIRVDGVMSHFAAADDPSCGPLTGQQLERFDDVVSALRERGYNPQFRHLANSAGIFAQPKAWGNMVRPGGILYGLWRDILPPDNEDNGLQAVMSLHSRIMLLKWVPQGDTIGYGCTFEASRETRVATIPIGYEDGYMRGLSNRGHVIVRGTYAPVVGRISMDLTIIDVTNVPDVEVGDQVTLLGRAPNDPKHVVTAEELAKVAGTLSYEVTCGVSSRVPRIYRMS